MDIKTINISNGKPIKTRVPVMNWNIRNSDYDPELHLSLLMTDSSNNMIYKTMVQQIQTKISGYKSQDVHKKLLSLPDFVTIDSTLDILRRSGLKCYYCKEYVRVFYENVREPKQWTLDRIDNSFGHTTNNVEISCLSCNLRRKTMYHERYIFTKQLTINKLS